MRREATNAEVQPSWTNHERTSPSSVTSEHESVLQRELSSAREEIIVLHEKIVECQQQQKHNIAAASEVQPIQVWWL